MRRDVNRAARFDVPLEFVNRVVTAREESAVRSSDALGVHLVGPVLVVGDDVPEALPPIGAGSADGSSGSGGLVGERPEVAPVLVEGVGRVVPEERCRPREALIVVPGERVGARPLHLGACLDDERLAAVRAVDDGAIAKGGRGVGRRT